MSAESERADWVAWLEYFGAGNFYDSFMAHAQGAKSKCAYCGSTITLDIREGGGVPDWGCEGDYGCPDSPDTGEDGTGGHRAIGAGS